MSDTKFTPGPWSLNSKVKTAINSESKHVAMVNYFESMTKSMLTDDEHTANANLIAAAPEMYQALELCINAMPIAGDSEKQDYARITAIDALAKARGEL